MPNRILRDGILSSERVCSLDTAAQLFYYKLLSVVDDYGRFVAHPTLLRSRCFPLTVDRIKESDIQAWLAAVEQAKLAILYEFDGKTYLQIDNFEQRLRAKGSKYPDPPKSAGIRTHVTADDSKCGQMPTYQIQQNSPEPKSETETGGVDDFAVRLYERHPAKRDRTPSESKVVDLWHTGGWTLLREIDAAHKAWCESADWQRDGGKWVPSLYRWLNDEGWKQTPPAVRGTVSSGSEFLKRKLAEAGVGR